MHRPQDCHDTRATPVSRRRLLAALGTASVGLLAGCSDGGGGGDGGDGGATATPTEASSDVPGSVSSEVGPLSIVEHRPRIGYLDATDETYFPVEVTVENGGDQQTNVTDYFYNVVAYDADDTDVTGDQSGSSSDEETEMGPGETASLVVYSTIEVDPEDVARYEVVISCENAVNGSDADGVYCQ